MTRSTGDGNGQARQVAVEAGERGAASRPDELGAERGAVVVRGGEVAASGEQGAQPVLLAGGRHVEVPQPRVEGCDVPHPRHLGIVQVAGPPAHAGAREVRAEVEDPARRHALHAAAQVATRDAQQLAVSPSEGGEELVVLALDACRPQGQLVVGAGALVVREEGVVAHAGRERALGEAEDHDEVEVERDAHLHRAHEHALAEAPHPAEVLLELELQGAVEHVEADRGLHGIEGTEAVQRLGDPFCGLALGRVVPPLPSARAAEEATQPALRPGGVLAPPTGSCRGAAEIVDDLEHEPPQLAGSLGLCQQAADPPLGFVGVERDLGGPLVALRRELGEAHVPVVTPGDDGGITGEPLPPGGGGEAPVMQDRRRRQPGEDVLAAVAARGQTEQIEQRATRHPSGEGDHGGAVGGDARGPELLVSEARVRVGARVEDRDAVEPCAGPHRVDDRPHCGAHLLVTVRCAEHGGALDADRGRIAHADRVADVDPEPAERHHDLGVGGWRGPCVRR